MKSLRRKKGKVTLINSSGAGTHGGGFFVPSFAPSMEFSPWTVSQKQIFDGLEGAAFH